MPNCHCNMTEPLVQHELQQHLLIVAVLQSFGEKLSLRLLSMIANTSPDEIILPEHRYLGKVKPLSTSDDLVEPLMINEVMYTTDSDQVDTQFTQSLTPSCHQSTSTNDSKHVAKTSILMPGVIQIHRQVLLPDAKISKETKTN